MRTVKQTSILGAVLLLAALTLFWFRQPVSAQKPFPKTTHHFNELSLRLTPRQQCDLEMIMRGGFAPLEGFLNRADYESVVSEMRLTNGSVWPMPIILDVDASTASQIKRGQTIYLADEEGTHLAQLSVGSVWQPDKQLEALQVYGTDSIDHPGVDCLFNQTQSHYVGGKITSIRNPGRPEFSHYITDAKTMRDQWQSKDYPRVVGFQTRNPMHRAHVALSQRAAKQADAHLLLQPVVGVTKPGDIDPVTRLRCYKKILKYYPENSVTLNTIPLAMRMAGPREALWHALIRKNYGCTHFIIGRDHAGPGKDRNGNNFYDPYEAQELVRRFADEIGVSIVTSEALVYVEEEDEYLPVNAVPEGKTVRSISGAQLRKALADGDSIPLWFSYDEVVEELRRSQRKKQNAGVTILFTGLSGSGKSSLARALKVRLEEEQDRAVILLDGDIVRTHLSKGLGFSKEDRSINVRRVGFVASAIAESGGISLWILF